MFWKKKTVKSMKPEGAEATSLLYGYAAANRARVEGNPLLDLDNELLKEAYLAFILGVVSKAARLWEMNDVGYMALITALFLNKTDLKPDEVGNYMEYLHKLPKKGHLGIATNYGAAGIERFLVGATKGLSKEEREATKMYFEGAMLEIYKKTFDK